MYNLENIIQMNRRPGASNAEAVTEAREAAKSYKPTGEYISQASVRDQVKTERERTSMMDWLKAEAVRPATTHNPDLTVKSLLLRDPTPAYTGKCCLCKERRLLNYREDIAIWICRSCAAFIGTVKGERYLEDRSADIDANREIQTPDQWKETAPVITAFFGIPISLDYNPCNFCGTQPTRAHTSTFDLCAKCHEFSITEDGKKYRAARRAASIWDETMGTPEQWQNRHKTTEKALDATTATANMEA